MFEKGPLISLIATTKPDLLTRRCVPTLFYLKQTSPLVFVLLLPLRLHLLFLAARTFLLQFKKPLQFVESFLKLFYTTD